MRIDKINAFHNKNNYHLKVETYTRFINLIPQDYMPKKKKGSTCLHLFKFQQVLFWFLKHIAGIGLEYDKEMVGQKELLEYDLYL